MKKYLALYMAPTAELDKLMASMTPEKSKGFDKAWKDWMAGIKGSLKDPGTSLGKNKRVTAAGIADVRNEMTGYSIVEADSHEAAAELFKTNPMFDMPGAYVEVVEMGTMPQ